MVEGEVGRELYLQKAHRERAGSYYCQVNGVGDKSESRKITILCKTFFIYIFRVTKTYPYKDIVTYITKS